MRVKASDGVSINGSDSVTVPGDLNNWSASATPMTKEPNDSIYTVTVDFPDSLVGTTFNYEFWTSHGTQGTRENDGVGAGRSKQQVFHVASRRARFAVVYFNNDSLAAVHEKVLFQADRIVRLCYCCCDG